MWENERLLPELVDRKVMDKKGRYASRFAGGARLRASVASRSFGIQI